MSQIKKKWIGNDQIAAEKVLLENNTAVRSKDSQGAEVELLKIDAQDELQMPKAPKAAAAGSAPEHLARLDQVDARIATALEGVDLSEVEQRITDAEQNISTAQTEIQALEDVQGDYVKHDGSVPMTGELQMGANKISGLAAGSASNDAVTKAQLDAVAGSVTSVSTNLKWRDPVFMITEDPELKAAVDGATLASVLPMSDDDAPEMIEADFPIGAYIICKDGVNAKLWKVFDDAGVKKIELQDGTTGRAQAIADGHTFMVYNDMTDAPHAQENDSIWNFNGSDMVKLSDVDFSLATGIDLSLEYAAAQINEAVAAGDSIEVAIAKLERKADDAQDKADIVQQELLNEVQRSTGEDATFLKLDGSRAMEQALPMGGQQIKNLAHGTDFTDAVNKAQLDDVYNFAEQTDGKVDNLLVRETQAVYERYELTAQDIANSSLKLGYRYEDASMVIFVGRLAIHVDEDYSIDHLTGSTRISFQGDINPLGGVSALEEGDVIHVYGRTSYAVLNP